MTSSVPRDQSACSRLCRSRAICAGSFTRGPPPQSRCDSCKRAATAAFPPTWWKITRQATSSARRVSRRGALLLFFLTATQECGLVLESHAIEESSEWRSFSDSARRSEKKDGKARSHAFLPSSPDRTRATKWTRTAWAGRPTRCSRPAGWARASRKAATREQRRALRRCACASAATC